MTLLDKKNANRQLSNHFKDGRLIPFIGSGFSQPLGLPSWDDLVKSIAPQLDFDPNLFVLHGSHPQLADYVNIKNSRVWKNWVHKMTVEFDSRDAVEKRKNSIAHKALAALRWNTIYTTNYDSHIEGALEDAGVDYVTLASLADFLEPRTPDACEIVKFHGTLTDPKTMILTESDYFDRLELESAPDQRLRSDILSNSFMFIGYSFNDPNIRFIWHKIHKLRRQQQNEDHEKIRPCYFIAFGVNPVQPVLLDRWNIHVVLLDPIDKPKALSDFLMSISTG
jgi:hypothetical protein